MESPVGRRMCLHGPATMEGSVHGNFSHRRSCVLEKFSAALPAQEIGQSSVLDPEWNCRNYLHSGLAFSEDIPRHYFLSDSIFRFRARWLHLITAAAAPIRNRN